MKNIIISEPGNKNIFSFLVTWYGLNCIINNLFGSLRIFFYFNSGLANCNTFITTNKIYDDFILNLSKGRVLSLSFRKSVTHLLGLFPTFSWAFPFHHYDQMVKHESNFWLKLKNAITNFKPSNKKTNFKII